MRSKPSKSSAQRAHTAASKKAVVAVSTGAATAANAHSVFFPLVFIIFVVWIVYRTLFHFPVWFDEVIGKAIFFGLPVWLYLSLTQNTGIKRTFDLRVLQPGILLGLAVGGVFGFAGVLATVFAREVVVQAAPLFASNTFWWEFFLALMTGFWESLFFFSWIMVVIQEKYRHWPLVYQVELVALIFLLFHIPNIVLRFAPGLVFGQMILLFFFAVGQALFFSRTRNLYALAVSHAIWGMVLLVHTR